MRGWAGTPQPLNPATMFKDVSIRYGASPTDAHVAGMIGKTAILYRAREEKPKIKLP